MGEPAWSKVTVRLSSPPWQRRGGRASRKWSEGTSVQRGRGGSFKRIVRWCLDKPPRLRRQRNGTIFLVAQPPLLCQGGEIRCLPDEFGKTRQSLFQLLH